MRDLEDGSRSTQTERIRGTSNCRVPQSMEIALDQAFAVERENLPV